MSFSRASGGRPIISSVFSQTSSDVSRLCASSDAFIGLQSYEMQAQTGQFSDLSISQYSGTWGSDAANSVLLEPELHTKRNIYVYQKMYMLLNDRRGQQKFNNFTFLSIKYEVGNQMIGSYNNLRKISCLCRIQWVSTFCEETDKRKEEWFDTLYMWTTYSVIYAPFK